MKEDLCYVSKNFQQELLKSKRRVGSGPVTDPFGGNLKKHFALPDYKKILKGFVMSDYDEIGSEDQVLRRILRNDILFHLMRALALCWVVEMLLILILILILVDIDIDIDNGRYC